MSNLIFKNVESLNYQRNYKLFGEIFTFNSVDSYSIRSRVYNTGVFESGVASIWNSFDSITETGLGYYGFIIDSVNLGTGKITSFNWEAGADLISKPYSISFEILSTGNLYNFTGALYSDINKTFVNDDFKYVTDLEENLSISLNEGKIQEFNQSVSFGIDDPLSESEKLDLRNLIFSGFGQYRVPNVGIRTYDFDIISGNSSGGYISYFSETSDLLRGRFSFQKQSFYDNASDQATWEYSHALQINGNEVNMTENGSVKSICFSGSSDYRNLSGARNRWSTVKTGIFTRLSETFNALSGFSGLFSGSCGLVNVPVERRQQENPFEGTIEYSYTYSNSSLYSVFGYTFENSRDSSIDQDGYYIITEQGEYQGIGLTNEIRFANASGGYYANNTGILSRISGTFVLSSSLNKFLCPPTGNFYLSNETTTFREYDGIISYSNSYSNNPSFYPASSVFVKAQNVITDRPPVHFYNKFLVPRSDEFVQSVNQSTEGSFSNNIQIIGKTGVSIDTYLAESYTKVQKPSGDGVVDVFLKSMNYGFDPFQNTFNATFEYYYSKYKEIGDTLV